MTHSSDALGAAEMLAVAQREEAQARRRFRPDDRFLYAVWGTAWIVGFIGLWLTGGNNPAVDAPAFAGWLYGVLMTVALVVTVVHIAGRVSGVRGRSQVLGQRFGATWGVAFTSYGLILAGLGQASVATDVYRLLAPVLACFIVGLVYMAGGAAWDDRRQFVLGVWICLVAGVAGLVGVPTHHLILAIGGGGGFLIAAVTRPRRSVSR